MFRLHQGHTLTGTHQGLKPSHPVSQDLPTTSCAWPDWPAGTADACTAPPSPTRTRPPTQTWSCPTSSPTRPQSTPAGAATSLIATEEGWLYLATVIDIASRRVVGWATADHLRTELVADALRAACRTRRPAGPVMFHSDRGCQYTSHEFALLAAEFDVRLSVGRTGQCWDNALAESFFATLKNEPIDARPWSSRAAARTAIFEWIESWYNLQRLHSSLGYRTPADYEAILAA
ncbi:IS3 family transposase [Actinacidiphila glaucinigra]|uniref:IS3 family transposase n=1 Tax=Actinacidiphila glaucinigra TaxID=235986 RepID=UPI002DDA348E|nr:IS3 family transposase [Actinacidiphila glaucinigra]WSD57656.1 IS3 family transposase [Actinacidiphila glaucinigra]